jgi:hypothetical protein
MKKLYSTILFTAAILFGTQADAQVFTIQDDLGNDITNGAITANGADSDVDVHIYLAFTNNNATTTNVKVKRYEMNYITGSKNYFCWATCYGSLLGGSKYLFPELTDGAYNDYLPIPAAFTLAADGLGFGAYVQPESNTGTALYRYVFFDGDNVTDSVYVDITFNIGAASITSNTKVGNKISAAYPNPANSQTALTYTLNEDSQNNHIMIYDMLGAVVKDIKLERKQGTVNINTSDINSGVYFYSLVVDDNVITTRKLVVTR